MAKQKTTERLEGDTATLDAPVEQAAPLKKWRVSLKDVKVRVWDTVADRAIYQDHLDVEAADPLGAIQAFGKHNGIPMTQTMEGRPKLASIHEAVVEEVE